jgi:hypothetical protein
MECFAAAQMRRSDAGILQGMTNSFNPEHAFRRIPRVKQAVGLQ